MDSQSSIKHSTPENLNDGDPPKLSGRKEDSLIIPGEQSKETSENFESPATVSTPLESVMKELGGISGEDLVARLEQESLNLQKEVSLPVKKHGNIVSTPEGLLKKLTSGTAKKKKDKGMEIINTLFNGPTGQQFDNLHQQVQDLGHAIKKFEIKLSANEVFNRRLQALEQQSTKVDAMVRDQLKKFDLVLEQIQDKVVMAENEAGGANKNSNQVRNMFERLEDDIDKFKIKSGKDLTEHNRTMHDLFHRIKKDVSEEKIKSDQVLKQVSDANSSLMEHHQKINLFDLTLSKYEAIIQKLNVEGITKDDVNRKFYALKSRILGFESQVFQLRQNLTSTDTFIDRYLPCAQLNLMYDTALDAFGDHLDRKNFCEKVVAKFKEFESKIKKEENAEAKLQKDNQLIKSNLNKKHYFIPEIKVPSSLDYEEQEESELVSEDDIRESLEQDDAYQERKFNQTFKELANIKEEDEKSPTEKRLFPLSKKQSSSSKAPELRETATFAGLAQDVSKKNLSLLDISESMQEGGSSSAANQLSANIDTGETPLNFSPKKTVQIKTSQNDSSESAESIRSEMEEDEGTGSSPGFIRTTETSNEETKLKRSANQMRHFDAKSQSRNQAILAQKSSKDKSKDSARSKKQLSQFSKRGVVNTSHSPKPSLNSMSRPKKLSFNAKTNSQSSISTLSPLKSNRNAQKQISTSPFPMMLRNQPTGNFDKRSSNQSMLNTSQNAQLLRSTTLTANKMKELNPEVQARAHQSVLEVTKQFQKMAQMMGQQRKNRVPYQKPVDYDKIIRENQQVVQIEERLTLMSTNLTAKIDALSEELKDLISQGEDKVKAHVEDLRGKIENEHKFASSQISSQAEKLHRKFDKRCDKITKDANETKQKVSDRIEFVQKQLLNKTVMIRSDMALELEKQNAFLGIPKDSKFECKINVRSLNRILEMILQYLMVHQMTRKDAGAAGSMEVSRLQSRQHTPNFNAAGGLEQPGVQINDDLHQVFVVNAKEDAALRTDGSELNRNDINTLSSTVHIRKDVFSNQQQPVVQNSTQSTVIKTRGPGGEQTDYFNRDSSNVSAPLETKMNIEGEPSKRCDTSETSDPYLQPVGFNSNALRTSVEPSPAQGSPPLAELEPRPILKPGPEEIKLEINPHLTSGAKYFAQKRLLLQAERVLYSAWLIFQEMNIQVEPSDGGSLKQLKQPFKSKNEALHQMRLIRSKFLPYDPDAILSFKAMLLYDDIIKLDMALEEQDMVTKGIMTYLKAFFDKVERPDTSTFKIKTSYLEDEKAKLDKERGSPQQITSLPSNVTSPLKPLSTQMKKQRQLQKLAEMTKGLGRQQQQNIVINVFSPQQTPGPLEQYRKILTPQQNIMHHSPPQTSMGPLESSIGTINTSLQESAPQYRSKSRNERIVGQAKNPSQADSLRLSRLQGDRIAFSPHQQSFDQAIISNTDRYDSVPTNMSFHQQTGINFTKDSSTRQRQSLEGIRQLENLQIPPFLVQQSNQGSSRQAFGSTGRHNFQSSDKIQKSSASSFSQYSRRSQQLRDPSKPRKNNRDIERMSPQPQRQRLKQSNEQLFSRTNFHFPAMNK